MIVIIYFIIVLITPIDFNWGWFIAMLLIEALLD
jgi:hypothetical protein